MPDHSSSSAKPGLTRPRQSRLRSTPEFRFCYDQGQRKGDSHLLVFAADSGHSYPRLGVSVSKKHGNAVKRNRKKRLLREAFRLIQHQLPPLDYVLVPRQSDPPHLKDYQRSLLRLANTLATRLARSRKDPPHAH